MSGKARKRNRGQCEVAGGGNTREDGDYSAFPTRAFPLSPLCPSIFLPSLIYLFSGLTGDPRCQAPGGPLMYCASLESREVL